MLGVSTDVNSGDVDDTFAIAYIVSRGFFVKDRLSRTVAVLRWWFAPFLYPYTVRLALESRGDMKLLVGQLRSGMYGRLRVVKNGFLSANFELILLYQSGYKVIFPQNRKCGGGPYELVPVEETDTYVDQLVIAGPSSCQFNTSREVVYVGRVCGRELTGANAGEESRLCVEKAMRNGANVTELPPPFSRSILCSLPTSSTLLASAAQLQLNPWTFSFLQDGDLAQQFADSNRRNGALLLAKLGLTYEDISRRLSEGVREKVAVMADRFSHWEESGVARERILWAVANFGGKIPWKTDRQTSVDPPFSTLSSILNLDSAMKPTELFEFRVTKLSEFLGLEEERVRQALAHTVLYDLYAIVLLKYRLSTKTLVENPELMWWFQNHLQTFVNSTHPPSLQH